MRLWSIHPRYLDAKGLVALWREGLLARKVLRGDTRGYRQHPQLLRFRNMYQPIAAIDAYLHHVYDEAETRGYRFDKTKLSEQRPDIRLRVTRDQLHYEFEHLMNKLKTRAPDLYERYRHEPNIESHPSFDVTDGPIESWEVVATSDT
ncbi:MAG: pyrimidine dimer DNA glycosylase/endonuclease V [Gammaproteobacteria bacterium]